MSARTICSILALSQGLSAGCRIALFHETIPISANENKARTFCVARRNWRVAAAFRYSAKHAQRAHRNPNDEEALARTLASLVGGAVEGVVREVIVCDAGSTDQTHRVAEHAGCQLRGRGRHCGRRSAQAKGDWLLLLEPGARLEDGWIDAAAAHVEKAVMAARFSRARASRAPFLSRLLSRPRALEQGLLVRRQQALVLSKSARSAEAIARGLAVKTLRAEIWPAPRK